MIDTKHNKTRFYIWISSGVLTGEKWSTWTFIQEITTKGMPDFRTDLVLAFNIGMGLILNKELVHFPKG